MKIKKVLCLIFSALLLISVYSPEIFVDAKSNKTDIKVNSDYEIENENFVLTAEKEGSVKLYVKSTGEWWYSNPVDEELTSQFKGINKMQMSSQLIVTYLVDGSNEKQATSFASATNKKGITVSSSKKGIRIDYCFKKEEFTIPVLYSLQSDGMKAEILNSEIEETAENSITKIILLPYWGAASVKENGYFLVPDGSGALINFNNGKSGSNYQQEIYNTDGLMNVTSNITVTDKAYMPIFGIKKDTQSALAVIDGGESACKLYSFVSGTNCPYNYIYPEFTYRKSSVVEMLSKTWYPLEVTFVSKKKIEKENFSVFYIPITTEDKTYSGMANVYREYLKTNFSFENKPEKDYVPVFLDIYATALVSDNFLGFPVTVNKSLTDCKEVEEIIGELSDDGISDINIRYKGITKSGLENKKVPKSFKVANTIGGKKGLKDLMKYAVDKGAVIYPDEDFIFFKKKDNSIFEPNSVIQDVRHKNGIFYEYDVSSGVSLKDGSAKYALKPKNVEKAVNSFLKSYKKFDGSHISLSTLSNTLYSDYSNDICLSNQTQEKFGEIFSKFFDNGIKMMLDSPYIYAVGYADCIIEAPIESSNYDIEDKSIPFYQMLLHGLVSYSTPSANSMQDDKQAVLKAVETGSSIMYSLSATKFSEIINDGYDQLSCIYSEDWLDTVSESGKTVHSALKDVADSEITAHSEISENVYKTEYDNGVCIYVNYGETVFETDGIFVDAMDFYVKREVNGDEKVENHQ